MQMGPIVLGIFLFVVIGSALFQILNVGGRGQSDILIWESDYLRHLFYCNSEPSTLNFKDKKHDQIISILFSYEQH